MEQYLNDHHQIMSRAIELARRGVFTVSPNPMVGCVIMADNRVVGEGWHVQAGGDHAEIAALREAGDKALGACAYVTLEPCVHHGRTGPCVDAIIKSGLSHVIVACTDPNPKVAGAGITALRDAGIEVTVGILEQQARDLNRGFIKRHEFGTPWVTIKSATSLDGRTAMSSGESKWITSPPARADVQKMRAKSCAVITGIGTQKLDNPSLDVRLDYQQLGMAEALMDMPTRQPLRVVVDSRCQIARGAKIFERPGQTLIATTDGVSQRKRADVLRSARVETHFFPGIDEKVDLESLLVHLAERGCNNVMVEAGAILAGAFVQQGLLDEIVLYCAPKLFGSNARPMFDLPIDTIDAHLALTVAEMCKIGEDIRVTLRPDKDY